MRLRRDDFVRLFTWMSLGIALSFAPLARAAVFDGGSMQQGLLYLLGLQKPVAQGDIRSIIVSVARAATGTLSLLAVISVMIAGGYLIAGMGSDSSRDRAKKICISTLIGLLVVIFARLIVETVIFAIR